MENALQVTLSVFVYCRMSLFCHLSWRIFCWSYESWLIGFFPSALGICYFTTFWLHCFWWAITHPSYCWSPRHLRLFFFCYFQAFLFFLFFGFSTIYSIYLGADLFVDLLLGFFGSSFYHFGNYWLGSCILSNI